MALQPQPSRRFVKIILNLNMETKKLRLPLKFVGLYGNELADTVKLLAPDTRVWEVKVIREEGQIWLDNGFEEFSKLYSLKRGHQVHFKYKGTSHFSVRVFNLSGCQITYPPLVGASSAPPKPKTSRAPCKKRGPCNYQSESGIQSPRHFKSKRPHFEVNLKDYNFRLNVLYVPLGFSKKHFTETQVTYVNLETCDGRRWEVAFRKKKKGRFSFGKGWNIFSEANGLKEGDVCIFELTKKPAFVFTVHIFVAM